MIALSRIQIIRPSLDTMELRSLTSAGFALSSDVVRSDAVDVSGVAWDSALAGLLSWQITAEATSAPDSLEYQGVKGAHRTLARCIVAGTAGDRLTYYGPAVITGLSRGGDAGGVWGWSMTAESGEGLEILPAPLNLRITAETAEDVTLAWDAVDADEYGAVDGYTVYASMTSGRPYEWSDDVGDVVTATVNKTNGVHYVVAAYRVL
jgi:hypothetical protein